MNPPSNLPPYGLELWNAAQACIRPSHNGTKGEFRDLAAFKDLCSPSKIVALLRELALGTSQKPISTSATNLDAEKYMQCSSPAECVRLLDELDSFSPERGAACRARLVETGCSIYPPKFLTPTYGNNTKVCDHCKLIHPRGEMCPIVARTDDLSRLLGTTLQNAAGKVTITPEYLVQLERELCSILGRWGLLNRRVTAVQSPIFKDRVSITIHPEEECNGI